MTPPRPLEPCPPVAERVLGHLHGQQPGPYLMFIGGIHGNEPAGVEALRSFFRSVEENPLEFQGEIVGLVGNRQALDAKERYLNEDLNRVWREEFLDSAKREPRTAESREAAELLEVFDGLDPNRPVFLLDLHTASAEGPPFMLMGDTLRNRSLARWFPIPLVLGLEERIVGALLDFVAHRGWTTLGFEGGQHDDPESARVLESVIWIAVGAVAGIGAKDPRVVAARKHLESVTKGFPRYVEVRDRHGIEPEDQFAMRPGFRNLEAIKRGTSLADDRGGPVDAPESGLILLPLYQGLGDDGFFLARPVRSMWFPLSAFLRRRRLDRILHLLPGVRRDPDDPHGLIIHRRIAVLFAMELFHLLGYRRVREEDRWLFVRRRPYDLPDF